MKMNRGYTKRWRKRWDKDYHKDHLLWVLMDYLIDHANYRDKEVFIKGYGLVLVKRGQHLFGSISLAEKLGATRKRVESRLKALQKVKFLRIKRNNRFSIATILNYDKYNPLPRAEGTAEGTAGGTAEGTAGGQPGGTPNKDKKGNKEKNKKKAETFGLPSGEILNEASIKKIREDLEIICEKLYQEGIFSEVHTFKNLMLKNSQNERAVLHALTRCYLKAKSDGFKKKGGAWGYCTKIMQVENGNYNEREHQKTAN
jgi:hypothetical protein